MIKAFSIYWVVDTIYTELGSEWQNTSESRKNSIIENNEIIYVSYFILRMFVYNRISLAIQAWKSPRTKNNESFYLISVILKNLQ